MCGRRKAKRACLLLFLCTGVLLVFAGLGRVGSLPALLRWRLRAVMGRQQPRPPTPPLPPHSWTVIFPFHGGAGSQRLKVVNASWHSLCRAMRTVQGHPAFIGGFRVVAVDDTGAMGTGHQLLLGDKRACSAKLARLERLRGRGDAGRNVEVGLQWASQHAAYDSDFVMTLESDMLLRADYFVLMLGDYRREQRRARTTHHLRQKPGRGLGCQAPLMVLSSGYTSARTMAVSGGNWLFSKRTLEGLVLPALLSTRRAPAGGSAGLAWDELVVQQLQLRCRYSPSRPNASYIHHWSADGTSSSFEKLGQTEHARGFEWDTFNRELARAAQECGHGEPSSCLALMMRRARRLPATAPQ
jgi:hypothetical protein